MEALLREMEAYAEENHVPIIRDRGRLAYIETVKQAQPRQVLEVGAAIGYSGLLAAMYGAPGLRLDAIEHNTGRVEAARLFWARTPYAGQLQVVPGDATELLSKWRRPEGGYDFVFLDAAKGQYADYFRLVLPLLADTALVVADNVLFRGYVRGKGPIPHRFRTIAMRLREYLTLTSTTPGCSTEIVKCGDGLAVTTVRKDEGFAAKQA